MIINGLMSGKIYEPIQMSLVEYLTQWFATINYVTVCVQCTLDSIFPRLQKAMCPPLFIGLAWQCLALARICNSSVHMYMFSV